MIKAALNTVIGIRIGPIPAFSVSIRIGKVCYTITNFVADVLNLLICVHQF